MAIIDKIKLSGQTFEIQDSNASKTVELTQAEYDALVTKDPNTYYIITDATPIDITNYYTKTQTDDLLDDKLDVTAYTPTDLSNYYTKSETSGATQISTALASKQDTLQSGTNIKTINNESILGSGNIDIQGGGKAVTGGTNISITTGETADTINCTLPISADTRRHGTNLIFFDNPNTINHNNTTGNFIVGYNNTFGNYYEQAQNNFVFGNTNTLEGYASGNRCLNNFVVGNGNFFGNVSTKYAVSNTAVFGQYNKPKNNYEFVFGQYNNSVSASTTFGDSGNTLFSVGNGTADNARHNAFEIRQNGDIYLTLDGQDVKLQDQLGGSSINVVQTTGTSTTDVMSQNAVSTKLSGYVTTGGTDQTISGKKVFTYSSSSGKAIEFKQTSDTAKVGFSIKNSASTNNEVASFEFRPNTFTIDGVQHPLMYFGHYRNTSTANAGVPQTVIGFRQYDQKNAAAYHYLMPLPEKAKTPFRLTTTFKDYYAPIGFKNGSTMITADDTGVVDLSSEFSGKVDTSLYNTYTAATDTALASKQTTLTAGTGISIVDNVISATGGGGGGTVESAITSGSTNAVESKAIWSATTFNKGVLLTFDGLRQSTNYPEGCTKLNVEVVGSNNNSIISFFNNDDQLLGNIDIDNWGSIDVNVNFDGASYEISGTTVIISYPSTDVTYVRVGDETGWTYTAVVEGAWVNENTYMKPEVDAIASGLQNNINSKLDATAYTPTVVDSALYAGSTNPVKNQVLYSELRIDNGETETTLTFENSESTNYPNGCTKLNVEVVGSNNNSIIGFFNNDDQLLGNISIDNWGSIDVNVDFDGASYEISGTTVIITYPTVTNVTKIEVDNNGNYVFKAIVANATPLIDQVAANTTALGGLSLVKLTQAEYDALVTKDSNTLYVING